MQVRQLLCLDSSLGWFSQGQHKTMPPKKGGKLLCDSALEHVAAFKKSEHFTFLTEVTDVKDKKPIAINQIFCSCGTTESERLRVIIFPQLG